MENHEQQADQESGAGSSDHHHADERPGHGHRERQTHRRYPRGPDSEGSGRSPAAIRPAQGRRYDATATDRAPDVLSLQGRVHLLQHSRRRRAVGQRGLELRNSSCRRIGNPGIPGVLPGPGRCHRDRQQRLNSVAQARRLDSDVLAERDDPATAASSMSAAAARAEAAALASRSICADTEAPSYRRTSWAARRSGSAAPASFAKSVNSARIHERDSLQTLFTPLPARASALARMNAHPPKLDSTATSAMTSNTPRRRSLGLSY